MNYVYPRLNYKVSVREFLIVLSRTFSKSFVPDKLISVFETEYIYMLDNARSGIELVLSLLPQGSKVGVQPLTCPTVLEAIERAKCSIVFIDINKEFVIDEHSLELCLNSIDSLIVTHCFGNVANVDALRAMFPDKLIIEDCAHAFLSENRNSKITGKNADISVFSFGFAKFPSAVKGGYLVFNNEQYAQLFAKKYKSIVEPAIKKRILNFGRLCFMILMNSSFIYSTITASLKEKKRINFSYRKPDTKATISRGYGANIHLLNNALINIEKKRNLQQFNAKRIIEQLQLNKNFSVHPFNEHLNYFMLPALVDEPKAFIDYMKKGGIEIGRHFVQSTSIIPSYNYMVGSCQVYEQTVERLITFPTHYNYSVRKTDLMLRLIKNYK